VYLKSGRLLETAYNEILRYESIEIHKRNSLGMNGNSNSYSVQDRRLLRVTGIFKTKDMINHCYLAND
jgi:hypothetical protein